MTRLFTGQRLDSTGLYYYNARYYDPLIGRFISADTAAPDLNNPQSFNKYSYCFNNPLNRTDPTGNWPNWSNISRAIKNGFQATVNAIEANPIGVLTTVACIAALAVVAAPLVIAAAAVISTAVSAGGIGGLATLGAAAVGVGTAAVEEEPEIESSIANTVDDAQKLVAGIDQAGSGLPLDETMGYRYMSGSELQDTMNNGNMIPNWDPDKVPKDIYFTTDFYNSTSGAESSLQTGSLDPRGPQPSPQYGVAFPLSSVTEPSYLGIVPNGTGSQYTTSYPIPMSYYFSLNK